MEQFCYHKREGECTMDMNEIQCVKNFFNNLDAFSITMDVDWASDFAIESAVNFFQERRIPITLFFTHMSPYIDKLITSGSIAYGIHPNFIQPSSQGRDKKEVIDYCMGTFPYAEAFRSHRWYADNDIYTELYQRGIRYESNLCTLLDVVEPFVHRSGMISFPVFFEDGAYLYHGLDLRFASAKSFFEQPGIKVVNIHPMHLMVNTPDFLYMRKIKDTVSREAWNSFSEETIRQVRNKSARGITDFVTELMDYIGKKNATVSSLADLYHMTKERMKND